MACGYPYVSLKSNENKQTNNIFNVKLSFSLNRCTALAFVENPSGAIFMSTVARLTQSLSCIHQCDN